jgi:hypothetical protein
MISSVSGVFIIMTSLPLTKKNLKTFIEEYSKRMEGKQQGKAPSVVSFASTRSSHRSKSKNQERKKYSKKLKHRFVENHLRTAILPKLVPLVQTINEKRRKMAAYKEGYLVADVKDSKFDPKSLQSEIDLHDKEIQILRDTFKQVLRQNGFHGGGSNSRPFKIKLWMHNTQTSSATTAQAPVQRVRPSDSAEFTSLQALFDEFICIGGVLHFRMEAPTAVTSTELGVAYDPVDSATYGSVLTLCAAQQKCAPMNCHGTGQAANPISGASPLNVDAGHGIGYYNFKFHAPIGPQVQPVNTSVYTGDWCDATISQADYGYLKFYAAAPSAGTTTIDYYLEMHCEFRSRT